MSCGGLEVLSGAVLRGPVLSHGLGRGVSYRVSGDVYITMVIYITCTTIMIYITIIVYITDTIVIYITIIILNISLSVADENRLFTLMIRRSYLGSNIFIIIISFLNIKRSDSKAFTNS